MSYCLKHILTASIDEGDLSVASVELAATILECVDPWVEIIWGYKSWRHLDAFYFRIQAWCHRMIWWSKTPQGYYMNVPFFHNVMVSPILELLGKSCKSEQLQQRG